MVVKKKKIQKQKGGELQIPQKLRYYFEIVLSLLEKYKDLLKLYKQLHLYVNNRKIQIQTEIQGHLLALKDELLSYNNYQSLFLLKKLSIELLNIFIQRNNSERIMIGDIKFSIGTILQTLFSDIYLDTNTSIKFPEKLIRMYMHILFIQYLYQTPGSKHIQHIRNFKEMLNMLNMFKDTNIRKNIIGRLLQRHNNSFNPQTEIDNIIGEIRRMFLEEYPRIYSGVPVFYGNITDDTSTNSTPGITGISYGIGYNQFICEKVGVSSDEKRNFTINPVGAIAWMFIDKINYLDTPLYKLLGKILRFGYDRTRGNKISESYHGNLPKLTHLSNTETNFCIAKDRRNGYEEVITGDLSKCSKIYGCSLKMTPNIREENISPNEDILKLLDILLNMYLENETMFLRIVQNTSPRQDFPESRQEASAATQRRVILRNTTSNQNRVIFQNKIRAEIKRIQTAINKNHNLTDVNKINLKQNHINVLKNFLTN